VSFFCLETKEAKVQGCNFLVYKSLATAKTPELASLRTADISLRSCSRFAYATKLNALASLMLLDY